MLLSSRHSAVACVELCLDLGLFTFFVCAFRYPTQDSSRVAAQKKRKKVRVHGCGACGMAIAHRCFAMRRQEAAIRLHAPAFTRTLRYGRRQEAAIIRLQAPAFPRTPLHTTGSKRKTPRMAPEIAGNCAAIQPVYLRQTGGTQADSSDHSGSCCISDLKAREHAKVKMTALRHYSQKLTHTRVSVRSVELRENIFHDNS